MKNVLRLQIHLLWSKTKVIIHHIFKTQILKNKIYYKLLSLLVKFSKIIFKKERTNNIVKFFKNHNF